MWEDIPLCGCKIQHIANMGVVFPGFCVLSSSKHANPHTGWQVPQSDHVNSLHVDKEINSLWLRSTMVHTGYTYWMFSMPYSVKFLPSLLWTTDFRNTRNCGTPWNTQEGHSFQQKISEGQKSTPFLHGTEHIQSEWLKPVPKSEFGDSTKFLQISEWQLEQ
jgi:hypothetical protein